MKISYVKLVFTCESSISYVKYMFRIDRCITHKNAYEIFMDLRMDGKLSMRFHTKTCTYGLGFILKYYSFSRFFAKTAKCGLRQK